MAHRTSVSLKWRQTGHNIVYCKDADRRGSHEHTSFDFLGYTFRPRLSRSRFGDHFLNFSPLASGEAKTRMRREMRRWRVNCRSDKTPTDLALMFNLQLQGWINYHGRFYKSMRVFCSLSSSPHSASPAAIMARSCRPAVHSERGR